MSRSAVELMSSSSPEQHDRSRNGGRSLVFDVVAILALVLVSHCARLTFVPVIGEEGRRARSAINMIETGDWVVVQNQGVVFPDRPPMTNWLMAITGLVRGGDVDLVAIRLPSALAVLATAFLLLWYCRRLGSPLEALFAATLFVTFGQVLQLGSRGESEAVFTLFLAASLLVWHMGFASGWSKTLTWSAAYGLAALAALTKGLQAPVYFVGATAVFLVWKREWRWLLGRGQWTGIGVFLALVLAWQIPYYLATGWQSTMSTWFDVVAPRLGTGSGPDLAPQLAADFTTLEPTSLWKHLVAFPLEVFGSLLPWSPVLLLVASPAIRRGLRSRNLAEQGWRVGFLLVALAVSFPTVWFSAGAKSRYYMPLYPLIAIVLAMVLAHAAAASQGAPSGKIWRRISTASAFAILLLTTTVLIVLFLDEASIASFRPPPLWAVLILATGLLATVSILRARSHPKPLAASTSILLAGLFVGGLYNGSVLTQLMDRRQDIAPSVSALRAKVPQAEKLVSFGPIHTNFLYFWGDLVPEIPWPRTLDEVPRELEHFAFDRRPSDTREARITTRGMTVWTTSGVLPFEWQEIGAVDCGKKALDPPQIEVVIGRVVRDARGRPVPARSSPD